MTVSLAKPVSLVKRPRTAVTVRKVSLDKVSPIVRAVRLWLSSRVLSAVDVVERRDGSVWYAARLRLVSAVSGERTDWQRVYRPFHAALSERRDFEAGIGALRYVTFHNRMD